MREHKDSGNYKSLIPTYRYSFTRLVYVTGFWKTVPNHTFLFQYIYHCKKVLHSQ